MLNIKQLIYFTLSIFIVACASYDKREVAAPTNAIQHQVNVLSTWSEGTEIEEIRKNTDWYESWRFELIEKNLHLGLFNVENPETRATFGMYFENGKLVSLLSNNDADFLLDCLTPFNRNGEHWVSDGLLRYKPWVAKHSIIGNKKALAASGVFYEYAENTKFDATLRSIDNAAGQILTAVVYAPFILPALPFMLGNVDSAELQQSHIEKLHAFFGTIKIGQNKPILHDFPPDSIFYINGITIYQYNTGSFAFGLRANKVVMIEDPAVLELYERQKNYGKKFYSRNNCQDLVVASQQNGAK